MDDATPSPSLPAANGAALSTPERLQAASLAQAFVLQLHNLKAPLRARVLEDVRRLLGEDL